MKSILGVFAIVAGVVLVSLDMSKVYHDMPMSLSMLIGGLICAMFGCSWIQGERPRPI